MTQTGMERRLSERIPTIIGMQVYAYGMLIAHGESVDMSGHGLLMRIKQDYSADELDPGKYLEVMLEACDSPATDRWLPIRVVRKWEHGIAARFIGLDVQTLYVH